MTPETELTPELIDRVMKLSPSSQDRLIAIVLDGRIEEADAEPDEVRKAWADEIARRWERYKSGEEQAIPVEDVIAELRARAERRRS